ncbi:MAG: hypothetical protein NTU53_15945, partial [Planctomycetota bacterium]|nr:hypothetical protein [Planctomycetota bacterium]
NRSAQTEQHPLQAIFLGTSLTDVPSAAVLRQLLLADNAFSLDHLNHLLLLYDWRQHRSLP